MVSVADNIAVEFPSSSSECTLILIFRAVAYFRKLSLYSQTWDLVCDNPLALQCSSRVCSTELQLFLNALAIVHLCILLRNRVMCTCKLHAGHTFQLLIHLSWFTFIYNVYFENYVTSKIHLQV